MQDTNLSKPIQKFLNTLEERTERKKALGKNVMRDLLTVDPVASALAKFYEQVRRIIDWKEEHLVRRTAIERILKRDLIAELSQLKFMEVHAEKLAEPLVLEIIRSGYFESGVISSERILQVQNILTKYIYILKKEPTSKWVGINTDIKSIKDRINFYNWLMEIASCEIEETLSDPILEKGVLELMTEHVEEVLIAVPKEKLSPEEIHLQVYVAVHKSLYRLDEPIIEYHLLRIKYPEFLMPQTEEDLEKISNIIVNIWKDLEADLDHPNRGEFFSACQKVAPMFLILSDVFNELKGDVRAIRDMFENSAILEGYVATAYEDRIKTLKKRIFRAAIFSVLSIFVAGILSLLVFEIPIAHLLYGSWSVWAIVADILIPTALMFVLVSLIKPPSDNNLVKLRKEVLDIVYTDRERTGIKVRLEKRRRWALDTIFVIFYIAGGLISLWCIFWVFSLASVPWSSLYIDTANIALVVFAAMLIRAQSREVTVEEKHRFWEIFVDFFSIPLAKFGFWLAKKWKEYNIVSVFFSTLIDVPFSTLLRIIEGWREFVKEKHAEIH